MGNIFFLRLRVGSVHPGHKLDTPLVERIY
jgi:hypothetical protein